MLARRTTNNWLPSLFGDFFYDGFPTFAPSRQFASPAVNIRENDKEFDIEVAAPGMCKQDLCIQIENDDELVVTLEKNSTDENKEQEDKYLRREFSYTSYRKVFSLPDIVDNDNISAKMNDGVLTITLPKKDAAAQAPASRRIEIA